MNIDINDLLINFSNSTYNYLLDFIVTFSSILITAIIGWLVYVQQEKRKRVKDDISHFFLLFFSITRNHEYAAAILNSANIALKELDKHIDALNRMEYLIDCYLGKKTLDISIQFPDEDTKKSYIINEYNKLKEAKDLRETYVKNAGLLKEIDYEKEALFLANWGNLNFQAIYKSLESEYKQNNHFTRLINQAIESEIGSELKIEESIIIYNGTDDDYSSKIEKIKQKALFFKHLYDGLKDSAEYIIFYSDLAVAHLMHFNSKFVQKYNNIIGDLDIDFSTISMTKLYDIEKIDYYLKHKEEYQRYANLPEYKLLNKTLFEKLLDLIIKRKP